MVELHPGSSMLVSVVVPVCNEQDSLYEFADRIRAVATQERTRYSWEVILIDDGSTDRSDDIISELCSNALFKSVTFTRNFGHQIALIAGMRHATGQAVVTIDGDLQDPPELIPALLREFERGYDVVNAVRLKRSGEGRFKRVFATLFYRIYRRMVTFETPIDSGDFRLISRRVQQQVLAASESSQYLRGQVAWFGYASSNVSYNRQPRVHGKTKYPFRKSLALAANAIVSLSGTPLRVVTYVGLVLSPFLLLTATAMFLVDQITNSLRISNYVLLTVWLLTVSVLCFSFAVIAAYLGRLMFQVRRLPLYVVATTRNLEETSTHNDKS